MFFVLRSFLALFFFWFGCLGNLLSVSMEQCTTVYIYYYGFTFIFTAPKAWQWSFSNLWAPERQPYPGKGMWTMEMCACQWKYSPLTIVMCHPAPHRCHIWAHEFPSIARNHTDTSRWQWFMPVMALALIQCQDPDSVLGSETSAVTKLSIVCT